MCCVCDVHWEFNKYKQTKKKNIFIMDAAKMSSPSVTREDELQQLAIHAAGNRFPNERRPYGMFSLLEKKKGC